MTNGPLMVLPDGFGRAAEKLAETIRHVVDVAVGPDRIRAKAQGQADAEVIRAKGRAEVQDIQARADARIQKKEVRRQRNLESITLQALRALPPPEQISEEPVNEDWTSRFFEDCQDISDEQMQQIWARILAGEIARPGSFSPRTLRVVRDLTKSDADMFAKLCEFTWNIPGTGFVPVILDVSAREVAEAGISFGILLHLTTLGLIELNSAQSYTTLNSFRKIAPSYFNTVHRLDGGQERDFEIGHTVFTVVGLELFQISGAQKHEEYRIATLARWLQNGWTEDRSDKPAGVQSIPI